MDDDDDMTPACHLCGQQNIEIGEPAMVALRGEWRFSPTYDVPIYVLDPSIAISVMELPNGQIALVMDTTNSDVIQHSHEQCMEQLVNELPYDDNEDDDFDYEEVEL